MLIFINKDLHSNQNTISCKYFIKLVNNSYTNKVFNNSILKVNLKFKIKKVILL